MGPEICVFLSPRSAALPFIPANEAPNFGVSLGSMAVVGDSWAILLPDLFEGRSGERLKGRSQRLFRFCRHDRSPLGHVLRSVHNRKEV